MKHLTDEDRAALRAAFPSYRVKEIAQEVSEETGIPVDLILSKDTRHDVAAARWVVIRVFHRETGASMTVTARAFDMNHASIRYALDGGKKRRSPPE